MSKSKGDSSIIKIFKSEFVRYLDEKFWPSISLFHWCATYLDPTLQKFMFVTINKERLSFIKQAHNEIIDFALKDVETENENNNESDDECKSQPPAKKLKLDPFQALRCHPPKTFEVKKTSSEKVTVELDSYENEKIICESSCIFNPITWWGKNAKRYPYLSQVAKQILVVPASSAEAERIFSTAGKITRKDRARLDPKSVESQVLLADALKKKIIN